MARNPSQNLPAPSGMDASSDPVYMDPSRGQLIINFLINRPQRLVGRVALHNVLPATENTAVDGVGYYYNATQQNLPGIPTVYTDLLLWVSAGQLHSGIPPADVLTGTCTNVSAIPGGATGYAPGGAFFIGKRVRFASLQDETLMVQDGGLLLLRFFSDNANGTGFFRAGIQAALAAATLYIIASGVAPLNGDYQYRITFYDERGRESDLSDSYFIALAGTGAQIQITWVFQPWDGGTPIPNTAAQNVKGAYVYRNVVGETSTFYRIANVPWDGISPVTTAGVGDFLFDPLAAIDDQPDSVVVTGTVGPDPGENDPPNPASILCVHRNRVFLNDVTNTAVLQISNVLDPTAFAQIPVLPTDGSRQLVGTDQGDAITALCEFGSVLGIWKRRQLFFLYGSDFTDWQILPVHDRGCIAPDSCVRCGNLILFLSDDGNIYAQAYQGGDVAEKISTEIEPLLMEHTEAEREAAAAFFVDNRYHIQIGTNIYVRDFTVNGWVIYQFQDPGSCKVTLSYDTLSVTASGGTFTVSVYNSGVEATTYAVSYPAPPTEWVTLGYQPPISGDLVFTVAPNPDFGVRTAIITICDDALVVTQSGTGGPGTIDVSNFDCG